MTDIEELYDEIIEKGTFVNNVKFKKDNLKALSVCDEDGDCLIEIDENQIESTAELKSILLHEGSHCEMHTFYNENVPLYNRERFEYRTDKHVAETKITKTMIARAYSSENITEAWEFAEYFNVTVSYMKRILYIHFQMEFLD